LSAGTRGPDAEPQAAGIAVFALTRGGAVTAGRIARYLDGALWLPEARAGEQEPPAERPVRAFARVGPALRQAFLGGSAVVCVMAAGVVIRTLAPILGGKGRDAAVLVVDEGGRFVVPLLSGHVGGANALAMRLADALGAQAVITTSSDVQGLLGPDLLAQALDAHLLHPGALIAVSAALVNGEGVDLVFDAAEMGGAAGFLEGLEGYRPREQGDPRRARILIGTRRSRHEGPAGAAATAPSAPALGLVPRWIVAGVGCRRGVEATVIMRAIETALAAADRHPAALASLATIEAKAQEPGLRQAAETLGLPLVVVPDETVRAAIATHHLAESEWVRQHVGLGAASEPAALAAAGEGARLVLPKQAGEGTTVALALRDGGAVVAAHRVAEARP